MSKHIGVHEDYRRSHEVAGSSERSFGIVFAIVFLIIAFWPLRSDLTAWHLISWWALAVGVSIAAIAFLRPALLRPANRLWLKFGLLLSRIVNPVVMAVLFFGVVTPFGIVMRLFGKDPMHRKFNANKSSYWVPHDGTGKTTGATMKNQF